MSTANVDGSLVACELSSQAGVAVRAGQTVAIGAPLDPTQIGGEIGYVVRLRRQPWGDGADVTRSYGDSSTGWSPTWIAVNKLYPIDNTTYRAWDANRRAALAKLRATTKPVTSTWEERQAARELHRAALVLALHKTLMETWRRNGILPASAPKAGAA